MISFDFEKDFKKRSKIQLKGKTIGSVPLENDFYAKVINAGLHIPSGKNSIKVALCHKDSKKMLYAFSMLVPKDYSRLEFSLSATIWSRFVIEYSGLMNIYSRKFLSVRESLKDISAQHIRKGNYQGLPSELELFHYWLSDSGNVIMAIPECLLEKALASGNMYGYEAPVPCSYVMRKGYRFHDGHVIVDVPYDPIHGVNVKDRDW